MSNEKENIRERLLDVMMKECQSQGKDSNLCECMGEQIKGIQSMEEVSETNELFRAFDQRVEWGELMKDLGPKCIYRKKSK